jgi:hypothetical protein
MSYIPSLSPIMGRGGIVINGLGDSILGQSICQNVEVPDSRFPARLTNTAYTVGQCVQSSSKAFRCTVAGTSTAGAGPTPTSLVDGTGSGTGGVTWALLNKQASKCGYDGGMLGWAEIFSLGALSYDMTQGYAGFFGTCRKVIILNGGSNYSATPTITMSQGASATATVTGGVITAVTLTNPGYGFNGFTPTVTDTTGSGAVLFGVIDGSGNFGVNADGTAGMVNRLADCIAAKVDMFVVQGGLNDLVSGSYSLITGNLKICYETLMNAGRMVIAMPILPRTGISNAGWVTFTRVNRWIRAYCRGESWANPSGYSAIALADPTGLVTDGTVLTSPWPIGGATQSVASVTYDGAHPSVRGGMLTGYSIWQAAQMFLGPQPATTPRNYSAFDGYDFVSSPGGNLLEGVPWVANTSYALGRLCSNSGNVYIVTTAGTSAASGGPTGTTTATDNGVTWSYLRASGASVFGSGTAGTITAATGITTTGSVVCSNYTLLRMQGTASGTVTGSIENPWSDGHVGTRQKIVFSLGAGTNVEQWQLRTGFNGSYASWGIVAADLGVNSFYAECEVELSGFTAFADIYLSGPYDPGAGTSGLVNYAGNHNNGVGVRTAGFAGDVIAIPNNGRMLLRTTPMVLPTNLNLFNVGLFIVFDASGAAGSATATVKVNYMAVRRAFVS